METSWGNVAGWYDELLEKQDGTYQKEVILPNLLRVLAPERGETILDIACGQGFFSREIAKAVAGKPGAVHVGAGKGDISKTGEVKVIASDIAKELVAIARNNPDPVSKKISYHVASADSLDFFPDTNPVTGADAAIIILALQNIENIHDVFKECARVLKSAKGRLIIVLNHPAFRIPKRSSWQWDEKVHAQYRRLDAYMSDSRDRIDMHPGKAENEKTPAKKFTVSFHRPLQVYFKALSKSGFAVTRLEEWVSHKQSSVGPRAREEDRIRKEIPMFLMIEAKKLS